MYQRLLRACSSGAHRSLLWEVFGGGRLFLAGWVQYWFASVFGGEGCRVSGRGYQISVFSQDSSKPRMLSDDQISTWSPDVKIR